MPKDADFLASLRLILGAQNLLTLKETREPFETDWRGRFRGSACAVALPRTNEQISQIITCAQRCNIALVPQGGNTSLVGGAVPNKNADALIISTRRMNKILAVDPMNKTILVEAGVCLADLQKAAQDANLLFPVHLGSAQSCQIGGMIASNAGGLHVLRYGSMRQNILGLEVVLPDGQIWNGLRTLRKDNSGYDLKQLFIGSEGTLGVITKAVLALKPRPQGHITAWIGLKSLKAALKLLQSMQSLAGEWLNAFEFTSRFGLELALKHFPDTMRDPFAQPYNWYILLEIAPLTLAETMQNMTEQILMKHLQEGLIQDVVLAQSEQQRRRFWALREEGIVLGQASEGYSIKHDVAVPLSKLEDFIHKGCIEATKAIPGLRPHPFGHLGDGSIHFNFSAPLGMKDTDFANHSPILEKIIYTLCEEMDGTISAEHGIGALKTKLLQKSKSPVELTIMRLIKQSFDSKNQFNPGKIL